MDLTAVSVIVLSVAVTLVLGYYIFRWMFPNFHYEIDIAKAFDAEKFDYIISVTQGLEYQHHSLNVYLYAARARVHKKEYLEALRWFESALLKLSTENIEDKVFIELEICDIYTRLDKYDQAEIHCRTALQLNEDHPIANYKLAQLHFYNKKYDSCRQILRSVLKKNPKLADAGRLYAECLVCMGHYTKAIRQYGVLARAGEKIVSYNYARTLKALKIWERAYETYILLLNTNIEPQYRDKMICELAEITVVMKRFPQGLGLIEKYLKEVTNPETIMELRYIRANLFDRRGDKIIALKEFYALHKENPFYKDLSVITSKNEYLLQYPFLSAYFTSNETLFEQVAMNIAMPGSIIIRRMPEYYLVQHEDIAHVFYRDTEPMPSRMNFDIHLLVSQLCFDLSSLQTWSLKGINGHYSLTGADYRFRVRKGDDFLLNVKDVIQGIGYAEQYVPAGFINGIPDAPELIPLSNGESIDILLQNHNLDSELKDDILERAFDD